MAGLDFILFAAGAVLAIVWFTQRKKVDIIIAKCQLLLAVTGTRINEDMRARAMKDLRWAQQLSNLLFAAGICGALMMMYAVRNLG